jgi:hypothetical protein
MEAAQFVRPDVCEGFASRCLFYPSAGTDTETPLAAFLPWIDDYWFVDIAYNLRVPFARGYQVEDARAEGIVGTTIKSRLPFRIDILHERRRFPERETPVNIHWCRGRGYDAFRVVFAIPNRPMSVFFHRGDSPSEGGSNFYWLGRKRLVNVVACLEPGGLVVSDGSNAMRQFRPCARADSVGIETAKQVRSFAAVSRQFACVGYLGERNGPTLVWKTSAA